MQHTRHLADLLGPDADPLDREAHFAACEFTDYCVDLGMGVPDFARTRAYFRRNLGIRREFNLSIEPDLKPVGRQPLVQVGCGWWLLAGAVLVAGMLLGELMLKH